DPMNPRARTRPRNAPGRFEIRFCEPIIRAPPLFMGLRDQGTRPASARALKPCRRSVSKKKETSRRPDRICVQEEGGPCPPYEVGQLNIARSHALRLFCESARTTRGCQL